MSDQDHYTLLLSEIQSIPLVRIKRSPMPVTVYAQAAMDLYHWSLEDVDHLGAVNMDPAWVKRIAERAGALRYAESLFQQEFNSCEEAVKAWTDQSLVAYEVRDELLRYLRFLRRKDDETTTQLGRLVERQGNTDLIHDLTTLADLGRQHIEELSTLKLDPDLVRRAAVLATEMADLLAQSNGDRLEGNTRKMIRDQAVSFLKEAVDEVRAYGKFVFFDRPERLKGYVHPYADHQRQILTNGYNSANQASSG